MLSFQYQNYKKNFFQTDRVYPKRQTRVTANQHIFKSGLTEDNSALKVTYEG